MLTKKDQEVLRELAQKYMDYASLPIQAEKRALWQALNRRQMQKPMVLIDQMPWHELKDASLVCSVADPYWHEAEWFLRSQIYKWEHLPVDMVLTPYIPLNRPISNSGFGLKIEGKKLSTSEGSVFSYEIEDTLATEEDLAGLHPAVITCDAAAENELRQMGEEIFRGIAPVKMTGQVMHLGIWDKIAFARSVTNCYIDLLDRPEFIHALMEKLTGYMLDAIDQYNAIGAFDVTSTLCHCSHTFSDDLPIGTGQEHATSAQAWSFGMAQLFSSVSPEVTEEFEVPYMSRVFDRFGAIYYGCCEQLHDRLDVIRKMPKIRKISCSPWSIREEFAANLPQKYIMSNKPNPAFLASDTFDEQQVRDDLRRTMNAARAHGLSVEMILKDISTVKWDPSRLWRWAEIAAEETANF